MYKNVPFCSECRKVLIFGRIVSSLKRKLKEDILRGCFFKNNTFRPSRIGQWYRAVSLLYNNRCIISGDTKRVVCHHLNALSSFPELGLDPFNGVCISRDLHFKFHTRFDSFKGTCTREDFALFFKEETGRVLNLEDYMNPTLKDRYAGGGHAIG